MTSNDPKERSWDQTYIWVIESGLTLDNLEIFSMISLLLPKKVHLNISSLPYNGLVRKLT